MYIFSQLFNTHLEKGYGMTKEVKHIRSVKIYPIPILSPESCSVSTPQPFLLHAMLYFLILILKF